MFEDSVSCLRHYYENGIGRSKGEHQRVHGFGEADSCCRVKHALYPVLRIAVALKLFGKWMANGMRTRSRSDLAAITNAEEALMGEY
jgi:alpha/beta superfamily hydrolase